MITIPQIILNLKHERFGVILVLSNVKLQSNIQFTKKFLLAPAVKAIASKKKQLYRSLEDSALVYTFMICPQSNTRQLLF